MRKKYTENTDIINCARRVVRAIITFLMSAVLLLPGTVLQVNAEGEEAGYTVNKLDMRVAVSKDHIYEVEEFISVDIFDSLQELEFAIPDGTYRVTDPELLTTGHHRYTVEYTIKEPPDRNNGTDLFSFYVVLPEWKQPVETVHVLLAFPYGFPVKEIKHHAINNGEPDAEDRFDHKPEEASRSYTATGKRIPGEYTFWLEAELPDGYWENTNDYVRMIKAVALITGIAAVVFLIIRRLEKGNRRSMHP